MKTARHPTYGATTMCVRVARPIPPARRSRSSASPSAPPVIRGGRAGASRAIPLDAWNNFTGDMGGTTRSTRLCLDGACSPTHADMAA